MEILRNRYINPANLLTYSNLILGFISIICSFSGRIDLASYCLFLGMLCDFLDGFVARILKINSDFGMQLDSLADIISFGIAPGAIMFVMIIVGVDLDSLDNSRFGVNACSINYTEHVNLKIHQWSESIFFNPNESAHINSYCENLKLTNIYNATIKYLPFIALLIPLFSMVRLAKFNVDKNQSTNFIGLATPAMTFFILFFPLFFHSEKEHWFSNSQIIRSIFDCYFLSFIVVIVSILMILPFPMLSLKFKSWSFRKNLFKYMFLITSLISILFFHLWSIPLILLLYLIFSFGELIFKNDEIQS